MVSVVYNGEGDAAALSDRPQLIVEVVKSSFKEA